MKHSEDGQVSLTREELYGKVWMTPMSRLAPSLGLSDVGLAKICKRHKIPRPPVGYWARLEHGKRPGQALLPQIVDESLNEIIICRGSEPSMPMCEAPRIAVSVLTRLTNPHPLVAQSHQALKDRRPDKYGRVSSKRGRVLDVSVSHEALDRSMRICDGVAKALESLGGSLRVESNRHSTETVAVVDGERIRISMLEKAVKVEEELSEAEKKRRSRFSPTRSGTSYVYRPTGVLTLHIEEHLTAGTRKNWSDGKRKKLEDHLPEFLEVLHLIAAKEKADRVIAEKRAEEQREYERIREEKLQEIRDEERRLKRLLTEVDAWQLSQRIREYIDYVTEKITEAHGEIEKGNDFFKWADWAREHADHIDPLLETPPSILDEKQEWE